MKIRWLPLAVASLDHQIDYIAQRNSKAAIAVGDRVRSALGRLGSHPESARTGRVEGTRELVVAGTPFVIIYRVRLHEVLILRVLHGKQRWPPKTTV